MGCYAQVTIKIPVFIRMLIEFSLVFSVLMFGIYCCFELNFLDQYCVDAHAGNEILYIY